MDLLKQYDAVNAILNQIDLNSLFEGFHKYRFALYSSKEIIMDGNVIPYQEDFRGNTSILYEGEYIAIWNMEFDPVDDPEYLASCLVHEMFHCHQRTNEEVRYPSDLDLLNYPDDIQNYIRKCNENRYLANAYIQQDISLFRKFACIRENRFKRYPAMVLQEMKAETIEGMAEYIGLKALARINIDKYTEIVNDYLKKLTDEGNLLFDVRRISYYTGTVFFLCLDLFGFSVKNSFDGNLTAYQQNSIDISEVYAELFRFDFIAKKFLELTKEKESTIAEHIQHANYMICDASICGYDPMNMFRLGDIIYCSHFVCLNQHGEVIDIHSPVALKLAEGSNQTVVGYYI